MCRVGRCRRIYPMHCPVDHLFSVGEMGMEDGEKTGWVLRGWETTLRVSQVGTSVGCSG